MKFIVILRNPIERAFSQWNMQRTRGIEPLDFMEAVREEPRRIAESAPKQLRKFSYVDRGRYAEQLERAFRLFPRERFLVIKYEEFRARQREVVEAVFRFLGLSPPRFRAVEAHDIPYARNFAMKSERRCGKFWRARLADWRRCWAGIAPIGAKPSIDEMIPRMRLTRQPRHL